MLAPSSLAIEVNLGDGWRQEQAAEIGDEVGVAVEFDEEEQESNEEVAFEISESDEEEGGESNKDAEAVAEGEEGEDA